MSDLIYQNNIKAMRDRFSDIIDLIEKPENEVKMIDEEADVSAEVTVVAGKPVLIAHKGEKTYQLDSLYDNGPMLDLWFKGLRDEWDLDCKVFMYGMGNGMYVRKFLRTARPDCAIVVHEPSYKIFRTVLHNFDLSDIFTDVRVRFVFWPLYIGMTVKAAYEGIMSYTDVYTFSGSNYLNYAELFTEDCKTYVEGLKRVREFAGANQIVYEQFGGDFTRNIFNNLDLLGESKDIQKLAERMPEDIPAIVVAAGPSLDRNIRQIAKAKGKCLIISTDTALKPLSLAGIVPDIAAIMDGKKDERYLSQEDSRRVPLVCTPKCGNEFLHLHTGMKFFTDDFCAHLNTFMEANGCAMIKLPTGGSVANACFALARLLKCRRIILVGQDLAYTGDKTHSAVTVRGEKKTEVDELQNVVMDVDINGDPIRSSSEFKLYKEWFEQQISADPELDVVDATEGGIRIAGTKLMTLKDAIEEYCTTEFDFSETVRDAAPLFDDATRGKYNDLIRKIPGQMSELRRMIRSCLADYRSMRRLVQSDDYHGQRMKQLYDKCKRQTQNIENSPVIEYVHYQLQGKSTELLDKVNKLEKDEKQELLTVCDIGERYLEDMDEAISELEPYMESIKRYLGPI